MPGVVVPAHDEADFIGSCVLRIQQCARNPRLAGEAVELVVVADACTDRTALLAPQAGALTVEVEARNVGLTHRLQTGIFPSILPAI